MHEVKTIQEILNQITHNEILLPEFQRGYVWNRDQVRGLMQSLYRKHPTGHLLIWRTYKPPLARGADSNRDGHSLMLLDGQQRLTTLYVLFTGEAPRFYEGESLFFNLYFNVQTEEFRFWQKSQMENNPAWMSVHELLGKGLTQLLEHLSELDVGRRTVIQNNLPRLSKLDQVRNYTYTVDQVSGDDFGLEEVVNIFNRVNDAGTKLTKADLGLAHVCSIWPEARSEMRQFRAKMRSFGFSVEFDFLLRCLAGIAIGSIAFEGAFLRAKALELQKAWGKLQSAFEHFVGVLRHTAFVDSLTDLSGTFPLIPVTIYLAKHDGCFPNESIKKRFIRWFFLAGIWMRYSGSSETKLQQDVELVLRQDLDPTHELEAAILRERGRIKLEKADLHGVSIRSAVGRFARVVARANNSLDWFSGKALYDPSVGRSNGVAYHHIFSKQTLKRFGFSGRRHSKIVNEVANRVTLTGSAPRSIGKIHPSEYLPDIEAKYPNALRAQSVPMNRDLWSPYRYHDFLAERRRLLAISMNDFIESWMPADHSRVDESFVRRLMGEGESSTVEFKSSLRWDLRLERINRDLEKTVAKTVAGFLNSKEGGTLLIGVDDGGTPIGLSTDFQSLRKHDRDGFELHFHQVMEKYLGASTWPYLTITFHGIDGHDIFHVAVDASDHPVYVSDKGSSTFYLRVGNSTKALSVDEAVEYVQHHWN